ncbi:ribonuclease P protein subunit p25-like protein [Diabrotica virgifera virgifera]|uniref:Ribonuclease P protein subunit p25-like protein n=1 Tax=Diabrotica virgifera virgifera TaxID=50390 RepID=A0A6P7FKT1_DIAVI|nr:ribonuclease P protein subunit p25-like protein [Diabrotica virgifera virgifera]
MENYKKGKNIEEPLERNKIPIPKLPENFLWMQVRGGSKIRNLLPHAINEFREAKHVVWTGFGSSVGKCITCAEIMKREFNNTLHQITKICYRLVEEYWDPLLPELDQIVVKRRLPMIHIYLSSESIDTEELGYQAPGQILFFNSQTKGNKQKPRNNDEKQYSKRNQRKNRDKRPKNDSTTNGSSSSNVVSISENS